MKISIIHRTSDYRGDHAADVLISRDYILGETVEELVGRLNPSLTDVVEIRIVQVEKANA